MPIFYNFPGGSEKHHKEDPCYVKLSLGPHLKRGLIDCRLVALPTWLWSSIWRIMQLKHNFFSKYNLGLDANLMQIEVYSWIRAKRSPEKNLRPPYFNIYPTRCNVTYFILSGNCCTCFGWYHHPSSGAHTPVFTASGICHTVTATCHYRCKSPATHLSQSHLLHGSS
jgi:hypothetical protein